MNSVSNHSFSLIPHADIPRSVFDRSHNRKMTLNCDELVPIFVDEVLPGDSFKVDFDLFARLTSPLTTPVMDNMYLDIFWFYVPNRLVWKNWAKLCGEQENPGDSTDYLVPRIAFNGVTPSGDNDAVNQPINAGSLADAFGLPLFNDALETAHSGKIYANALPFRAYNLIYNEWFRDQNLIDSVPVLKDDADFGTGYEGGYPYKMLKRAKRHDYFSSCLPWPQKGPGVELPLGGTAPVVGNGDALGLFDGGTGYFNLITNGEIWAGNGTGPMGQVTTALSLANKKRIGVVDDKEKSGLIADLSEATAVTINSMRQAFQLQRLYERDARGGSRLTELIRAHFGVVSPDARLQRPEYLGGSSQAFVVNPISQTSATTEVTPQGNLVAIGLTGSSKRGFNKSFVEHGYIIGLANVRADINYQQGIRRMWSRRTRFDYYWPVLAHLGEQAVLNKEIYVQGDGTLDNGEVVDEQVFGYQERWAEYRYFPNEICGQMRSTYAQPLDNWHLAQYFTSLPKLNKTFIESNTPISRVEAVQSAPDVLLDINFRCKAARPMPVYSVPGLIDHF